MELEGNFVFPQAKRDWGHTNREVHDKGPRTGVSPNKAFVQGTGPSCTGPRNRALNGIYYREHIDHLHLGLRDTL